MGAISSEPAPVVTRVVFTDADLRARSFMKGLCREAGLHIREDAVGNTFGFRTSPRSGPARILTPSPMRAVTTERLV